MIYIDIIQTCMTSVTCTGCPNLNLNNIYIYIHVYILYIKLYIAMSRLYMISVHIGLI